MSAKVRKARSQCFILTVSAHTSHINMWNCLLVALTLSCIFRTFKWSHPWLSSFHTIIVLHLVRKQQGMPRSLDGNLIQLEKEKQNLSRTNFLRHSELLFRFSQIGREILRYVQAAQSDTINVSIKTFPCGRERLTTHRPRGSSA